MSERLPQHANPFSAMTSIILIGVGTLSFILIFALMAWSPELANKNRAGSHPYSTSAIGYGGLVKLLEADGQTVSVSRLASTRRFSDNLLVLTLPSFGFSRVDDFDIQDISEPALFVLPKWSGEPDRDKPSWQRDTDAIDVDRVTRVARAFDSDLEVVRVESPRRLSTPFGQMAPQFDADMQVLQSERLEPVIETRNGALLSKLPGRAVYVLSDPDLVNTFGLARRENARLTLSLIDEIKDYPTQSVTLDATLHGFERSESLLRTVFDVPFLGASLVGLATMLLIGWSAFVRFAPPMREERVIAFGKKALAESSAGLISMARREGQVAPAYRQLIQRNLARRLGLPEQLSDEEFARIMDQIATQKHLDATWRDQSAALATPVVGRQDLRDQAHALWQWREEIKDGN